MKREYIIAIIGLLGAVIAALIVVNFYIPNRKIEILVSDLDTQKPIEEAIVKVNNDEKLTGNDGIVIFDHLKKGYLDIIVNKDSHEEFHGTSNIKGKSNLKKIELVKKGKTNPDDLKKTPRITFHEPKDGSTQINPVSVLGKGEYLPEDNHYWIVVNPHGTNGWWPQTREIILKPNNNWSGVAHLGGTNNKGQKFDVHFIMADEQAHKSFNDYLTEGAKTKNYPEKPLPSGAKSIGYLTLIKQ